MKSLLVVALASLCAGRGVSQVVQFWPISHNQSVISENNLGLLLPSWEVDNRTTEALSGNAITLTRSVYFNGVQLGRLKYYAPKRIETRLTYNWAGPVNGQEIVFDRPKATVGITNQIPASAMPALDWRPVVGSQTLGNAYWRITTSGGPLVCWGTNTSLTSPYLLRVPALRNGGTTLLLFRFEPGQGKTFTLNSPDFMHIYLDGADELQLPW